MEVEKVFVLMLENRSFDHLLGFSGLEGKDLAGSPKKIDGLRGDESNASPRGRKVTVSSPAPFVAEHGPGHEFSDVQEQLCGPGGSYSADSPPPGSTDPRINNSGYVANYSRYEKKDPESIMRCFTPPQLPVLNTLAREFAICDRWFSSMPGPTWPNRMFIHAGSSAGLDDSPSFTREFKSYAKEGFKFENGTIYDLLDDEGLEWSVYSDDEFPQALSLAGMSKRLETNFRPFKSFEEDVSEPSFSSSYVFIEPDYHAFTGKFRGGNSQHPMDDVTRGERLVKSVYESLRGSPHWEKSVLILTYDEHGGFYDHVVPPACVEPGDAFMPGNNHNGFQFRQLGVRVPTVVISPLVPRGTIDSGVYDHTSALATVEEIFGLGHLTKRDGSADSLTKLIRLKTPRDDTPAKLPEPAVSGYVHRQKDDGGGMEGLVEDLVSLFTLKKVDPSVSGFHHIALLRDTNGQEPSQVDRSVDRFLSHRQFHAKRYMRRVREQARKEAKVKSAGHQRAKKDDDRGDTGKHKQAAAMR